jgi:hypothetical protein
MDIEETKKAIAVMQAYVDGAKIIHRPQGLASEWKVGEDPSWNWPATEYRVAPAPAIRPFTPVEAAAHLGRRVKSSGGSVHSLEWVFAGAVGLERDTGLVQPTAYAALALNFKFENGEPCGVLIPQP